MISRMKNWLLLLVFILIGVVSAAQDTAKTIRIAKDLEIIPLSANAYLHVSWVTMAPYGRFSDNGLIYINNKEAVFMDTPMNDTVSSFLLDWFSKTFPDVRITYVIVNHFHDDCLGGLREFHKRGITSVANHLTNECVKSDSVEKPQRTFTNNLALRIGKEFVVNTYLGEAHSKDNIVTYIPSEKILFGGCMIKSIDGGRGYLGDANLQQWSATVKKVKAYFPDALIVIPGHGNHGGTALLDFTIKMFEKEAK
jgi:metallo-beta-lactamase class B